MSALRTIRDGEDVIAVVIPHDLPADGVQFLMPPTYPLQVGLLGHKTGAVVKPHGHKKLTIATDVFQEILIAQSVKIAVDLYGRQPQFLETVELGPGDAILFLDGGHGVRMLTDAKVLEVKHGPCPGVN